ncbi:adenylate/guanylate cyclase domain-containing protein [Roseofilum capinflatum]|uniref:GAF domain-containing protein n=1 Tax=Roseofilum capinflatum BLCC-M114 TaxID=3022440 RepID=A0ABT7BDY7_9CYAN|nr:adenylate/guanylate cyclase domain-containing protein [Roseofilum capinflatum]MDJ1176498.1 GAF domain-containing protein [Roseofilum capinflatum BLCC-M114]
MTLPNTGSVLATLAQVNMMGALTARVKDLPVKEFICLLDFITAEFQQFLRAIELINNEALEAMLEQILDALTLKIGQILQADRTLIFLVNEDKGQLWSKINQPDAEKPIEIRFPLHVGMAGHVAITGECLNVEDAPSHPLFQPELDKQTNYQTKSLLCMPILSSKGQVVAVVQLSNKGGGLPFSAEDEETFKDFSGSIGIILETCQSFYMAARNQRGAEALLKATQTLGQSLDVELTLRSVMEQARDLMKADRSTLFLLSKENQELWTKIAKADGKTPLEIRIPTNKGIAGYVASTGELLNIPNAYEDPRFDPSTDKRSGYHTRNILCMPVFNSEKKLIGVTQLINKEQGSFTSSDEEFMHAFNIQAGMALENAQLFESVLLEKQYQKDILESLSDAVVSTDMQGRIVTLNEAALELLGCYWNSEENRHQIQLWESKLIGRKVWEVVPIENLKMRIEDSLQNGTKQYIPEQGLKVGIYPLQGDKRCFNLAIIDVNDPDWFIPWNDPQEGKISAKDVGKVERSINLTVNPLTNPSGEVRGGLVVLEDISQEKRMKTTMYRYMNPDVVDQVMALDNDSLMIGERKDVTILFSDIRGYTTLTENLGAQEVVTLLNQYFETMVEAVFNCKGTLDKFIGDALMAVFGAPLPLSNHPWMAVKSALDMRRRLAIFNQSRFMENQPHIRIGIGISSGEVVSGNIGSRKRMDYTVIGDGVNLSARLEGVTKEYGCDIIISENTYKLCGDRLWVRELDKIRVKGKNEAVSIYQVIGDKQVALDSQQQELLELYHLGRSAYIHRDFSQAIHYFEKAQTLDTMDKAINIHIERAQVYLDNPPPESWDGVHTMTTK